MKTLIRFSALFFIFSAASAALAQTTSFTYQGRLTDAGAAANGNYDLQFALFDSASGGTLVATQTVPSVAVSAGIFTVQLDFGANAFPGANRWLEISARPAGSGGFTTLAPRQQIGSTPYAIRTLSAASADTATNATNATQLGGVAAANYVQTNDPRLSDARPPTAGSNNYIQNQLATVQAANFAISGIGYFFGGMFSTTSRGPSVEGSTSDGIGVQGISSNFAGVAGSGRIGVLSSNTSFFQGSNRPLPAGGTGVAIGSQVGGPSDPNRGFIQAIVYGVPDEPQGRPVALALNDLGGNVGIGTIQPQARLDVNGDARFTPGGSGGAIQLGTPNTETGLTIINQSTRADLRFNGTTLKLVAAAGTGPPASTNGINITTAGNVGIGTIEPARTLHVNGRVRIQSAPAEPSVVGACFTNLGDVVVCGGSSLRLKTNVQPFAGGLNILRRLRPISFDWKDGSGPDIGLGAEDVAQIAPSLTFTDDKGEVAGVKYERLNVLLINAVKEQQAQIESLRALNTTLQSRLRAVEKQLRKRTGPSRRR